MKGLGNVVPTFVVNNTPNYRLMCSFFILVGLLDGGFWIMS